MVAAIIFIIVIIICILIVVVVWYRRSQGQCRNLFPRGWPCNQGDPTAAETLAPPEQTKVSYDTKVSYENLAGPQRTNSKPASTQGSRPISRASSTYSIPAGTAYRNPSTLQLEQGNSQPDLAGMGDLGAPYICINKPEDRPMVPRSRAPTYPDHPPRLARLSRSISASDDEDDLSMYDQTPAVPDDYWVTVATRRASETHI